MVKTANFIRTIRPAAIESTYSLNLVYEFGYSPQRKRPVTKIQDNGSKEVRVPPSDKGGWTSAVEGEAVLTHGSFQIANNPAEASGKVQETASINEDCLIWHPSGLSIASMHYRWKVQHCPRPWDGHCIPGVDHA